MRLLGISIFSCLRHIIVIPENRITLPNESEILLYLYSINQLLCLHSREADQKVKLTWVSLFRFSAFEGVHLVFAVRSEDRLRFAPIKPDVIWPLNHHIIAVSHQNSYNFEY